MPEFAGPPCRVRAPTPFPPPRPAAASKHGRKHNRHPLADTRPAAKPPGGTYKTAAATYLPDIKNPCTSPVPSCRQVGAASFPRALSNLSHRATSFCLSVSTHIGYAILVNNSKHIFCFFFVDIFPTYFITFPFPSPSLLVRGPIQPTHIAVHNLARLFYRSRPPWGPRLASPPFSPRERLPCSRQKPAAQQPPLEKHSKYRYLY